MQRRLAIIVVVLGAVLVLGVFVAAASQKSNPVTTSTASLPPEGATYVGSQTCFQCHSSQYRDWAQTYHPKMIQAPSETTVLADFTVGEEVRQAEIGGETRAYTAEDITYTMGSRFRQRYIAQTDAGYMVLPGQWNVESAAWAEAESGDWLQECAGCHTTGFNVEEQTFNEIGVTCEACHGPGSVHAETAMALEGDPNSEEVYALRQTIVSTVDAAVCGQCHIRGTSPDGAHEYPVGYIVGGPLDETMYTAAASTGAEDDPNFWPDGTEKRDYLQYIVWQGSRHGNALATIVDGGGSDRCLACHSADYILQDPTFPQDAVTLENAQHSITCVVCHAPHGGTGNEDQLNVESYDLCVSCHTGTSGGTRPIRAGSEVHHPMREMFEGWSFLGIDSNPSPHFSNTFFGPVCASCHMVNTASPDAATEISSHAWSIVLPTEAAEGQPDSCTGCHNPERDPDASPESLTFYVEEVQEDTIERVDDLRADLEEITAAHPEWDPAATEKPEEQQIAESILTMITFVESDGSWGMHNPSFTDDILSEAEDLMDELLDMMEE